MTTRSVETRGLNNTEGGISGLKGIRDLSYKLIFTAINIKVENNQFDEFFEEEEEEEKEKETTKPIYDESLVWDKIYANLTQAKMEVVRSMR